MDAQINSVTQQVYTSTAEMNRLILLDSIVANMTDSGEGGMREEYGKYINFRKTRLVSYDTAASPEPGLVWNTATDTNNCTKINIFNNCDHYAPNLPNTIASNWRSAGHEGDNLQAEGKVDCIWVDPTTSGDAIPTNDIIIIGTACSGLWKTTNSGKNWLCITESLQLTSLGVVKIVVNKDNINEIWIGTGGFWNFSYGLFHTTDGGISWCKQNLPGPPKYPYQEELTITALVGHPTDPLKLVASNTKFLYTTLDGGNTWVAKARVPYRVITIPNPIVVNFPMPTPIGPSEYENWFNFSGQFSDIALDVSDIANNKIYVSVKSDGTAVDYQNSQHMFVSYDNIWKNQFFINPVLWDKPKGVENRLPFVDLTDNILLNNPLLIHTTANPPIPPSPQPYLFMIPRFASVCDANGDVYVSAGLGDNDKNNVIPANRLFNKKYTKATSTWEDLPKDLIPMFNEGGPNWHRNNIILDPTVTGTGTNTATVTNHVYIGGTCVSEIFKTTTGWTPLTHISSTDFITQHADINAMTIRNGKIYACTDAGLMVSSTQGPATWTSLNGDLKIGIANGMSVSPHSGNIVSALMDNGYKIKRGKQWQLNGYQDGYSAEYEVNGNMKNKFHFIGNDGTNWLEDDISLSGTLTNLGRPTPARLHQAIEDNVHNPNTGTYFAGVKLPSQLGFRQFQTITILKTSALNRNLLAPSIIDIIPKIPQFTYNWSAGGHDRSITTFTADNRNSKNVLFGVFNRNGGDHYEIFKTNAAGFINLNPTSANPCFIADWINTIATDPNTSGSTQKIWVGTGHLKAIYTAPNPNTVTNWIANSRCVFYSADGGVTFTDVSRGLTPYPINKLLFSEARNLLFAASDYGVFVLDVSKPIADWRWQCFNTQLPYTIVTDLEINECQGKLIASTLGRGIWETDLPPITGNTDDVATINNVTTIPTGTTTYNTTSIITKTIIVPSGAKLVIEGTPANPITLNFLPRKGIQVRKGGSLIVRNAILTNECGNLWAGISVDGDVTQVSQPTIANVPNPTNAQAAGGTNFGIAWLYNTTVSNAYTGMANSRFKYYPGTFDPVADGNSGGIIIAHNSKFINNRLAVSISNFGAADESRFVDNEFTSNAYLQGYPNGTHITQFVFAWDVKDVEFLRNSFFNDQSNSSYTAPITLWPTAIYGYDAGLKVTSNTFENMYEGVVLEYPILAWNTPAVHFNEMDNVYHGIYVAGAVQLSAITSNNIDLAYCPQCTDPCGYGDVNRAFGIFIDDCSSNRVSDNQVTYTHGDYDDKPKDRTYGILLRNLNVHNQKINIGIYKNNINDCFYGMVFLDNNVNIAPLCNNFTNNLISPTGKRFINFWAPLADYDADCHTFPYNTIMPAKIGGCNGFTEIRAGNIFGTCTNNSVDRFATDNTVNHIRYASFDDASHRLYNSCMSSTQVDGSPCNSNNVNYNSNKDCQFPPITLNEVVEYNKKTILKDSIDYLNLQIHTAEQRIDDDKTALLLSLIQNPTTTTIDLLQKLQNFEGLASDTILQACITKSILPLSNFDLKNLMITNSPLTAAVYAALEQHRPLVAYNYAVVNAQENAISPRQVVEQEILEMGSDKANKLERLVDIYIAETHADSAINMLLLNDQLPTALTYIAKKADYTTLQNFISAMPASDIKTIYQLDLKYRISNQNITNLMPSDSIILDSLARRSNTAGSYAKSMLHVSKGIKYSQRLPASTVNSNAARKPKKPIYYDAILPEKLISIQPNPTNNVVNLVNYDSKTFNLQIFITDVAGKTVYKQSLTNYQTITPLDIYQLQSGTYIISISKDNKIILNEKLVVIK